jgi:hypothetical protein
MIYPGEKPLRLNNNHSLTQSGYMVVLGKASEISYLIRDLGNNITEYSDTTSYIR